MPNAAHTTKCLVGARLHWKFCVDQKKTDPNKRNFCLSMAVTQENAGKWMRPLQPFMGFDSGAFLAAHPGGKPLHRQKSYTKAPDYCLNYKDSDKGLPQTRVRCTSQQWRWLQDEGNIILCTGLQPSMIAHEMVDRFILPIARALPVLFSPACRRRARRIFPWCYHWCIHSPVRASRR